MVGIPAGTFVMGSPHSESGRFDSEGPQHEVAIKAFALGKYDVTSEQFLTFLKETGYQPRPCSTILEHEVEVSRAWPGLFAAMMASRRVGRRCAWIGTTRKIYRLAERQGARRPPDSRSCQGRLSSADGSRMGVCRARRHDDGALVGQRHRRRQSQLQRLRQQVGQSAVRRRRQLRAQPFRALRHARQRLAMDRRLLAPELCGRAAATGARGSRRIATSTSFAAGRGAIFRILCARPRGAAAAATAASTTIRASPASASRAICRDSAQGVSRIEIEHHVHHVLVMARRQRNRRRQQHRVAGTDGDLAIVGIGGAGGIDDLGLRARRRRSVISTWIGTETSWLPKLARSGFQRRSTWARM